MRYLFLLIGFCWAPLGRAQQATLQGEAVDALTQGPLVGVNIVVTPGGAGAVSDADGRFVIGGLAPGVYRVQASYIGFETAVKADVVLQPSRPTFVVIGLREQVTELGAVTVQGSLFGAAPDAVTSVAVLSAEEIRRAPGGQNDISRSLLNLPGVVGGVDSRNDLLVRGGGPSENSYYVDGIPVPQINHFATQGASGGALGLLNIDFIREATFFTGGFPVRYGGALSSVLLVDNRPGSPDRVAGDVTLGAVETALTLDGPAGAKANWLLSARRSYLQYLFQALGLPIRPNYWDFQTRLELQHSPRDRFTLVGIGAIDRFDIVSPEDASFEDRETVGRVLDNDQWSYTTGVAWRRLFAGGFVNTVLSRSMTRYAFSDRSEEGAALLRNDSRESENHLRADADVRLRPGHALGLGGSASLVRLRTTFFERARPGSTFRRDLAFTDDLLLGRGGLYAQLLSDWLGGALRTTLGLRADASTFLRDGAALSPRAAATLGLGGAWSLNAATGIFRQPPPGLSLLVQDSAGAYLNRGLPYVRADHYVLGLSWQARPSVRLSLEGYAKRYRNYPVSAGDPRISLANLGDGYGYVGAEPLAGSGRGRAVGAELTAQKKKVERWYGSAAYSLGRSAFSGLDGRLRPSSWDVRHTVSVVGGLSLGRSWEAGVKWRYLSGRPYTPFDPARSAAEYALSRRGAPDYDRLNSLRSPAYHRLDVRLDRRFALSRWNAVVYLDVQNVYNRANLFGYEYTEDPAFPDNRRPVDNIGLLPNFGFSIEF